MAIYHLSAKPISRAQGRSSTGAAAYRAGVAISDERTGLMYDYRRKAGVLHSELILPGGGTAERSTFWNAIEMHHKRRDAVLVREVEISLPTELTAEQRKALAVGYARELADRYGVAADVALHAPRTVTDRDLEKHPNQYHETDPKTGRRHNGNWHAHIMLSACHVQPDGTLGKKAVELDPIHCQRAKIENLTERERVRWEVLANAALEQHGHDSRIDHRSHTACGIERPATRHLGPSAAGYERRTGRPSHRRRFGAPSQRQRRALAQQVEQQRQALSDANGAVQVLSGALLTAQQQRAAEWKTTVMGLRRRANAEAAERRQREARERIEAMSSAELAAEIERIRPPDLGRLVEADPAVIEARKAAERLSGQREEAAKAKALAEQQEGAWRLQHAYRSRLHDGGWWNSPELDEFAEAREAAHQRWLEVSPRVVEAEQRVQSERTMAEVRIREEQRPARDRVAALEALRQEKERQERAEAARQERERRERESDAFMESRRREEEAYRQAVSRQAQADRDQVARAFKSLAVKRAGRSRGFRDGDEQWEATPQPLQALVDGFNAMPKPRQERVLQGLRQDLEKNLKVEVWLAERKQTIEQNREQDHGLSM